MNSFDDHRNTGGRWLMRTAAAAIIAVGLLVTATAGASARVKRASRTIPTSQVSVSSAPGQVVPQSFLGLSMNVEEMEDFTSHPNFQRFVKLITPTGDGPFVFRVGGTYADAAYWNGEAEHILPQYLAPAAVRVSLNNAWLQSLATEVSETGSDVILNVNAAAHDPQMALDLIRAAERILPPGSLSEVAIGNEPNLYPLGYDGITRGDEPWVSNFSPFRYDTLFSLYATLIKRALPNVPLAGPELSAPTVPWLTSLLKHDRGQVSMATEHYYAYNACAGLESSNFPEIHKYFRASNISQATAGMEPAIEAAHSAGVPYRLTELGSSTCLGIPAVTDTFATSLWGLDQLFQFLASGVDGVNFHLRAYEANSAIHSTSAGLSAEPLLYGIAAFASTLGSNATLQPVDGVLTSNLKVWAVHSNSGWSLALINDTTERQRVTVTMPTTSPMTVKALTAATPWDGSVSFGGQTINGTGSWQGTPRTSTVTPVTGSYSFTIPPYSAEIASAPGS
jgi:hypothetical protein